MFQEPSLRINARQNQALTPKLQQAVRLLQLSAQDYTQELMDFTLSNPFLEMEDSVTILDPRQLEAQVDEGVAEASAAEPVSNEAGADANAPDQPLWSEVRDALQQTESHHLLPGEFAVEAHEYTAAEVELYEHLRAQARLLRVSRRDALLIEAIVQSIDDDGYLRSSLEELAPLSGVTPLPQPDEMRTALKLVQSLEPAGVGARTLTECLQLQLRHAGILQGTAHLIIERHLERLANNDVSGVARLLEVPLAEVKAAMTSIRQLDPKPGLRFLRNDIHYVTADVFVRKVKNQWVAVLNGDAVPRLRLGSQITDLFLRNRGAHGSHAEMAGCLQEARWTLRNMEKRFSTILKVAQAIVRRQQAFFEHGPLAMKPLALSQIAEDVGVHESTVCRVTNNKFMGTPAGTRELKYFFSRPMPAGATQFCSAVAIRALIEELVDAENAADPLSDVAIAGHLARQGVGVARRTVTKYRQALGIPSAERRCTRDAPAQPA